MINGEGWLTDKMKCELRSYYRWQIIRMHRYYVLPVSPSPNLNTPLAVQLYPSICFLKEP